MACELRRIRTVIVRLRHAVAPWPPHPIARRLLVVAGIAVGAWLLGGAGPAQADTSAGPAAGMPRAVLGVVSDVTTAAASSPSAERRSAGHPGGRFGESPGHAFAAVLETEATAENSVPGASSLRKVSGGLVASLREAERALPVHPSTVLEPTGVAWPADIDLVSIGPWPGSTGADLSWTPRQRHGADAGIGDRAGMRAPAPLALSGASKGGRATFGAALSHPAPVPGAELPQPLPPPAHVMRPATGPALTGGGVAHLRGPSAVAWPAHLTVPPPDVAGPAVRAVTDEPSCSPD